MLENFRSQKIIWDRANKTIFEKIEANSGDSNGRKLVVQVINQGVTENLLGATLSLGWKYRKGAKGLDAFNVVDASKGIFEIYYTTEMLSNIGNIEASLILTDSTGRIESSTFTISVTSSTVDDESVQSENSFTALTEALVKLSEWSGRIDDVEQDYANRANVLEETYAPRLTEATAQLAKTENDLEQRQINVLSHGLVGDGISDDTLALKQLIESLSPGDTLLFPRGHVFKVTDTIKTIKPFNIKMDSPIEYEGTADIAILEIGQPDTPLTNLSLELWVQKKTLSDWTNDNSVCIRVINLNNSYLRVQQTKNTTVGTELIGHGGGFSYNTIDLNGLYDHKKALKLTNKKGTGIGWINENLINAGRFVMNSNVMRGVSRYGVVITSEDAIYTNNNNNFFIKPSFELRAVDAVYGNVDGEAIPIIVEHGNQNEFVSIRDEGNSPISAKFLNESTENVVSLGYGIGKIVDESSFPVNVITSRRERHGSRWTQVFNSGALHQKNEQSDGKVMFENVNTFYGTSGTPVTGLTDGITINSDSISIIPSRAIGVRINTDYVKSFLVKRAFKTGVGRVGVIAYDSGGNRLINSSSGDVKGSSRYSPYFSTQYGGIWQLGSSTHNEFYFNLSENVSFVDVLMLGENNSNLIGFTIETDSFSKIAIPYKV